MMLLCQGEHCPVKNQCANYEGNITDSKARRLVARCTNQKSFIKKEEI